MEPLTKRCEGCGAVFAKTTERDDYQFSMKRYCSSLCRGQARIRDRQPPNPSGTCLCGCGTPVPKAMRTSKRDQTIAGHYVRYLPGHGSRRQAQERGGAGAYGFGRYKSQHGYIYVRLSALDAADRALAQPMSSRFAGFPAVLEHRLVMARLLGRPLARAENVHHRNGQRDDNRPDNLELWVRSQPSGQRAADLCGACGGSGLASGAGWY